MASLFRIRLKELREAKGLSQYSFADAFGISQSTIGNWEAGKREPNFDTMQRSCEHHGRPCSAAVHFGIHVLHKIPAHQR